MYRMLFFYRKSSDKVWKIDKYPANLIRHVCHTYPKQAERIKFRIIYACKVKFLEHYNHKNSICLF